jgi:anti-sigma regulatory factor (Ser/Thr protein kinase)
MVVPRCGYPESVRRRYSKTVGGAKPTTEVIREQPLNDTHGAGRDLNFEYVHRSWLADAAALRPIRDEVHRWLTPLELGPDTHGDLVYAVSEAATNAVEHAYRPPTGDSVVEVSFWTEQRMLYIEVVDHGAWKAPSCAEVGRGRGIQMMHRLADSVIIHYDDRGTRVLLCHPIAGPAMAGGRPGDML